MAKEYNVRNERNERRIRWLCLATQYNRAQRSLTSVAREYNVRNERNERRVRWLIPWPHNTTGATFVIFCGHGIQRAQQTQLTPHSFAYSLATQYSGRDVGCLLRTGHTTNATNATNAAPVGSFLDRPICLLWQGDITNATNATNAAFVGLLPGHTIQRTPRSSSVAKEYNERIERRVRSLPFGHTIQ